MATRTYSIVHDDLDNSEGAETVTFAFKGQNYEIDLGQQNQAEFERVMSRYVAAARSTGRRAQNISPSRPANRSAAAAPSRGVEPSLVREWATKNGITLSDRGRIPATVVERYHASTGGGAVAPTSPAKPDADSSSAPPAKASKQPAAKKATPKKTAAPKPSAEPQPALAS